MIKGKPAQVLCLEDTTVSTLMEEEIKRWHNLPKLT
jgi:hypothetical protein